VKKAFTLIELLVVIAIIAILAAILFPVFAQAKEAAKKTACLSNTNQAALSIQLYATDYDDAVAPWLACSGLATYCSGGPTLTRDRIFTGILYPYTKSGYDNPAKGLWLCPDWTSTLTLKGADQTDCDGTGAGTLDGAFPAATNANGDRVYADYGLAFYMCPDNEYDANTNPCPAPSAGYGRDGTVNKPLILYAGSQEYPRALGGGTRHLSEIARPSETCIAGDGASWVSNNKWTAGGTIPAGSYIIVVFGCESTFMHGTGPNFAFLDGHAKSLRGDPERYRILLSSGKWAEKYFYFLE